MSGPGAVLNYSTPRCFFERAYRHRSLNGAVGLVATLGFGAVTAFAARKVFTVAGGGAAGLPFAASGIMLVLLAIACAVGFVWLAVQWVRNATDPARITEDGVELKGRAYPWESIASVGGSTVAGGIMIEFTQRASGERAHPWLDFGLTLPKHVMTTPFLRPDEFENLMDALGEQVVPHHPHVKLDRTPRTPS